MSSKRYVHIHGHPVRGVFVSFKNKTVAKRRNISTNVFQSSVAIEQTVHLNLKNQPCFLRPCSTVSRRFKEGIAVYWGCNVLKVHASMREIKDIPSPNEW